MQIVEFKLSLNQSQQVKVNDLLNVQRWVWNQGLHLLEEFDAFTAWDKESNRCKDHIYIGTVVGELPEIKD